MIAIPPPPGMKRFTRVVQYNAFQFFADDYRFNSGAERFHRISAIPDVDPKTGRSRDAYDNLIYAFFVHDIRGESWRLNDGDWIVTDAMNPANLMRMTSDEFNASDFADESYVWKPEKLDAFTKMPR